MSANSKLVMKNAWNIARDAAAKFGGSASEYIRLALRQAWSDAKSAPAALPLLVGSEKQIAWAADIRDQVAVNVARALKLSESDITDHGDALPDAFFRELHALHKAQAEKVMANTDAKFWIESRVLALGAKLPDNHPSSIDAAITMLSDWDRANRAAIKAMRAKYR